MPQARARHWCWTLNNNSEDEEASIVAAFANDEPKIRYLVFGREVGDTGTPHLQGYLAIEPRQSMANIKAILGCNRFHLEIMRGTPKQASDYCKKDGNFVEMGEVPCNAGSRSDLLNVYDACRAGRPMSEIAEINPAAFMRYSTGILRAKQLFRPERTAPPQIWVFWGPTGTGKTKRVWEFANSEKMYVHPGDQWFDGYDSQPAVLFDDFDGSWFKLSYLLKLLDRYIFQVPIKGAYTWWNPKTIYFTSNVKPQEWYENANHAQRNALMRRFNQFGTIIHMDGSDVINIE